MARLKTVPQIGLLLLAVSMLAACGQSPQEKAQSLLESKQLTAARTLAQEQLKSNPSDPYFNALSAELEAMECVQVTCPKNQPELLASIKQHLSQVKGPIALGDKRSFDVYEQLPSIVEQFITRNNDPISYLKFIREGLPENAPQKRFVLAMQNFVNSALRQGDTTMAVVILNAIKDMGDPKDPGVLLSSYMLSFIKNDAAALAPQQAEVLKLLKSSAAFRQNLIAITPFLILTRGALTKDPATGANFFNNLLTPFRTIGLPDLATDESKKELSKTLVSLASDGSFIAQLAKLTPAHEGFKNHSTHMKMQLLHHALILDATVPATWAAFFGPALKNTKPGTPLNFLYDNINLTAIPSEVMIENNKRLLEEAQGYLEQNLNVAPLLKQIIYRPDAQQTFFSEKSQSLLNKALDNAIKQKKYNEAITYVTFNPDIANNRMGEIQQVLDEGIQQKWDENDFDGMEKLADFMNDQLHLPFSLDVKLVDLFATYLNSDEVQNQLKTDSPQPLLKSIDEAQLDLGPKMAYIKKRFAERPDIVQAKLKTLAIEIKGTYSTANTLLRLYKEIDDKNLRSLLTNAIKVGLTNDKETPAPELAVVGSKLAERWAPDITYNFVINEVFKRVGNIDQARDTWQAASPAFKEQAEKLRPQLASLMRGIDLFEAGKISKAAKYFAVLSDQQYVRTAARYTKQYDLMLEPFIGTYYYTTLAPKLNTVAISIGRTKGLLKANITMLNRVGSLERHEDFVLDAGQVVKHTFEGELDPESMKISIPLSERGLRVLNSSMERVYGDIEYILLQPDRIDVKLKGDKTFYAFRKVSKDPEYQQPPQGQYGITHQISAHDPNKDHVLPVGSVLSIKTAAQATTQEVELTPGNKRQQRVFPIQGNILHPASRNPIELSGYYLPSLDIAELTYSYPMNGGRTILDAVVRCEFLANHVLCAGHNRHWSRERYTHVVEGLEAK